MKVLDDNHAKLTRKQAFGTIPTVEPPANPARAMVSGDVQTIAEAAAMVDGYKDVPQTLKDFLKEEIAELTTNAVQLDVHVLDLANGDVSVHIQIKGIQLGPKKVVQS